jgi:hypothetical protein
MTITSNAHRVITAASAPPRSPPPRVWLAPVRASRAVLDGGWWPRSTDPFTELPGLVMVLSERYGPVRQLMLNRGSWGAWPRRLAVGAREVRIGWFASVDPAMAIATTERGDQVDLLVVPPGVAEAPARRAMARAADPTGTMRAPDLLAASLAPPARPPTDAAGRDTDTVAAWDNEGGSQVRDRPPRTADSRPVDISG